MIIEWIHHLFSSDTQRYPWHPRATYIPQDTHADPSAHYLQHMQANGIDRAVLVQPEPYGDDHSLVLDALQREPARFRATSLFYPDDPDAPAKLEALVKREPRIVATRFHAHRGKENYLRSFDDAGVRALWARAAELGLIVELHIGPNYAEDARRLIEAYPETPVLIDHLGEPQFGEIAEFANVLALAELPNVIMKISCIEYIAKDPPMYMSAARFTRQVADAFGADRLAWGGEAPAVIRAHLSNWPQADVEKVLGGNVQRLLNWP
jgi:predicted TIM-barrel fold metal-dependent hydrolase